MCNRSDLVVPSEPAVVVPNQTEGLLTRRSFGGLLVGAAAVAAAAPVLLHPAWAQPPAPQSQWRFCTKCNSLFFDGYADKGKCAKGGGHEAQGFEFVLPHDVAATPTTQNAWRFCGKCHAMFYDGFGGDKGKCAAGGGHAAAGFTFVLPHDIPGRNLTQNAWRFCGKCHGMFYDGFPGKGACPAGGGHSAIGFNFVLNYLPPPPPPQLDYNASPIGFKSGIAAGGWSHLTLFPDGRYQYKGHFHDSGAVSYKVGSAWMVRSASGVAFEFAKGGKIAGTFASGSRDLDWDMTGTNPEIQRNWAELMRGSRGECRSRVDVTINIDELISDVKKAVEVAGEVIKVVQVVAQLVG